MGRRSFYAEEKLDGYNVRLFCHNGAYYALTRGGFVCPFTTEWAEIWAQRHGLGAFFRDHPNQVLCGEGVFRFSGKPTLSLSLFVVFPQVSPLPSEGHAHALAIGKSVQVRLITVWFLSACLASYMVRSACFRTSSLVVRVCGQTQNNPQDTVT